MRHPLENFKSGQPRSNIISAYFHGYYYLGLRRERLRFVWRPADLQSNPVTFHVSTYKK